MRIGNLTLMTFCFLYRLGPFFFYAILRQLVKARLLAPLLERRARLGIVRESIVMLTERGRERVTRDGGESVTAQTAHHDAETDSVATCTYICYPACSCTVLALVRRRHVCK